jgi:23S rRNA (cytidine1920-2'-O)/16S rRNA (cytidine1409-2'-O)-methyltransferase
MAGLVRYRGRLIDKPGTAVATDGEITIKGDPCPYVSRGGVKLESALAEFGIDVAGKVVLDSGASTGGFTQCLLAHGAARVFAVDVGYGQLAWELRQDPRVTILERTNLRHLTPEALGTRVDLATLDLSFISLTKVLPAVRSLLKPGGEVLALVKPQFEAGRGAVGKGGIVRDPAVQQEVLERVSASACDLGFRSAGVRHSVLLGMDGNIEYFLRLVLDPDAECVPLSPERVKEVVAVAFRSLKSDVESRNRKKK